jgi:hypothetical protein
MRSIVVGGVVVAVGGVAAFTDVGWQPVPMWLFCVALGALFVQHGLLERRYRRQWRPDAAPDSAAPRRVAPAAVPADVRASESPGDEAPAASEPPPLSADDEVLRALGLEMEDSDSHDADG